MSRRAATPAEGASFEDELARLEAIVAALQSDGVPLDAALKLFEEGVQRLRSVTARLSSAEARVKLLTEDANGALGLTDFDA